MATRAPLGVAPDDLLVFTAGRLVRKKGFEYLVDAVGVMTSQPRIVLAIAGDGDLRAELEERRAQRRCRRTGAVSRQSEPGRGRGAFRRG